MTVLRAVLLNFEEQHMWNDTSAVARIKHYHAHTGVWKGWFAIVTKVKHCSTEAPANKYLAYSYFVNVRLESISDRFAVET